MRFSDWFDPYNVKHFEALRQYVNERKWPVGTVPDYCRATIQSDIGNVLTKVALMMIDNYEDLIPLLRIKQLLKEIKEKKDGKKFPNKKAR